MKNKIKSQPTSMLKEIAEKLTNDFDDSSDLVYDMVLNELETRLSESDFIAYVEYLDSLMVD